MNSTLLLTFLDGFLPNFLVKVGPKHCILFRNLAHRSLTLLIISKTVDRFFLTIASGLNPGRVPVNHQICTVTENEYCIVPLVRKHHENGVTLRERNLPLKFCYSYKTEACSQEVERSIQICKSL